MNCYYIMLYTSCRIKYFKYIQIEACRAKLYAIVNKNPAEDETPTPTPEWKKICAKCILPEVCRLKLIYVYDIVCQTLLHETFKYSLLL